MKFQLHLLIIITVIFINTHDSFSQAKSLQLDSIDKTEKVSKKDRKAIKREADSAYLAGRKCKINSSLIEAELDSYIQFEGPNGVLGVKLSLEDHLGFEKKKVIPKLDLQYSFNRHSSLYAEYYNISRSSSFDVDDGFDWGEIEVPEDAGVVDVFLNTQIWSVGYMYSFINKPHAEISFFANVFILGVKTGLDVERRDIHTRFSITAPLPSFGYRFSYEILPRVRFGGTHSLFFLQIGDLGGTINNFKLNLDYRAFKWLGAGISYSKFALDINSQGKRFKGTIEYDYEGPGLYLQFIF
jgi:hypothetical protein